MADTPTMASIKTILNITDTASDALLNVYITKGSTLITTYMNFPKPKTWDTRDISLPVDIPTTYPDALIEYVVLCFRKRGNEGIKQYAQGSRSGTYEDGLGQSVKDLLPSPFIRMARARDGNYHYEGH